MNTNAKIFVTGHCGMAGSAIVRRPQAGGYNNLLTRTHAELDLLDQRAAHAFLANEKPGYLFMAASRSQGRRHTSQKTVLHRFLYQNLQIEANLIHGARQARRKPARCAPLVLWHNVARRHPQGLRCSPRAPMRNTTCD